MESAQANPGPARLFLASGSSARLGLLREAGVEVTSCPVGIDEAAIRDAMRAEKASHGAIALALADAKALGFFRDFDFMSADFVIAADQILECDGIGFDKPESLDQAREQLSYLRGRTHHLQTALVLYRNGQKLWEHLATPKLTLRDFSEGFLDAYIESEGDALLSCVGAYRLEGMGVQLFEAIEGEHDDILGLPRLPLLAVLRDFDMVKK